MPTINTAPSQPKLLKGCGKVVGVGRNCPRPNGWFTCWIEARKSRGEPDRDDDLPEDEFQIIGTTDMTNLRKGMLLDLTVTKHVGPTFSDTYDTLSMSEHVSGHDNTIRYLASIPGVGRTAAQKVYDALGGNAVNLLKSNPNLILTVPDISSAVQERVIKGVMSQDRSNLIKQLLPQISSPQLIRRIAEIYPDQDKLEGTVKRDPYKLAEDVPGLSFRVADSIALMNFHPLSPYRVNHGITHVLDTMGGNDLYVNMDDQKSMIRFQHTLETTLGIQLQPGELEIRINALIAGFKPGEAPVVIAPSRTTPSHRMLMLNETYVNLRTFVNNMIARRHPVHVDKSELNQEIREYEYTTGFILTDEQRNAVKMALSNQISIITGGPGRGKTTIVDCIADIARRSPEKLKLATHGVCLLTPTGKAMARLREATHAKYPTFTIDKLIAVKRTWDKKPVSRPAALTGMNNALFIIDEMSMVELEKISRLMYFFPAACFCLVGDAGQLPPIGRGRVLHDVIKSGKVPVTTLTQSMRQHGKILSNAEKVASGDENLQWDFNEMPFFPQAADDQAAQDFILEQYNEERINQPDISKLAVLCPLKRGITGVGRLNIAIQNIVCPEVQTAPVHDTKRRSETYGTRGQPIRNTAYFAPDGTRTMFRVGDLVINTKNNYDVTTHKYKNNDYWNGDPTDTSAGIFNGDCGTIIAFLANREIESLDRAKQHDFAVIQFFDGQIAELDITMGEFEHIELAYAITVHKSQGSEYNTVIYVSPNALTGMAESGFANRNLLYTGLTRAKERIVVIGTKDSVETCIKTPLPAYNSDIPWRL